MMKKLLLLILMLATTLASAVPPVNPFVPPAAAAMFGEYKEGEFPVAQQLISADRYIGWTYGQPFRPFFVAERTVPVHQLPFQVNCCGLSLTQLQAGAVDVVHVYIDARTPSGGAIIGPVESLIQTADGVMVISAPYIGRRSVRIK